MTLKASVGVVAIVAAGLLSAPQLGLAEADSSAFTSKKIRAIAKSTAALDRPAKAAELIQEAPEETRSRVAIRVVRHFLSGYPLLAPNLVNAIVEANPELAVVVATEAITLFPKSAYGIAKAATAAAPEYGVLLALHAAKVNLQAGPAISKGIQDGAPALAKDYVDVLTNLSRGERVAPIEREESAAEAIVTVKFRIGGGRSNVPADNNNPSLNRPGSNSPQEVFEGVTQRIIDEPVRDGQGNIVTDGQGNPILMPVLVVEIDTGDVVVPEDLTGQEIVDEFDVILRSVLNVNENRFFGAIVLEAYVN